MSEIRSGLKDPQRSMRALGSLALGLEIVVLLLAILPIRVTQGFISGVQLAVLLGAIAVAVAAIGLMGKRTGWWLGSALQVALLVGGLLHWMIGAVGVLFGLAWLYVLYVRRRITTPIGPSTG